MLNISKQQALQRWEILPDSLREALFSEYNADTLWRICGDQHLSEDKISKVAILLGDVILGFAHLEDLAKDISQEIGINLEIANSIIKEIDRKILSPIKSDIEKNYKPAMPEPLPTRQSMTEIRPIEKPKPFSPLDVLKEAPSVTTSPPAAPKTPVSPATPIAPISPIPLTSSPMPSTPSAAPAEGPLIIHKETEFKPLSENRKSLGGFFNFLNKDQKEKKEVLSPVKARVEIGPEMFGVDKLRRPDITSGVGAPTKASGEEKKEPEKISTSAPKVRVVHYTDFSTPLTSDPFSGKIQPQIQNSMPIQKPQQVPGNLSQKPSMPFQPQQPQTQSKTQPTLRDLAKPAPLVPPVSPTPLVVSTAFMPSAPPATPATPERSDVGRAPKRVDFSVDETNDSTKKNGNLGENIIDLRSFK